MRVLVTGIGGFVGPVLAGALRAAGHEVHGLVRQRVEDPRLAAVGLGDGSLHVGDLAQRNAVARLVQIVAPGGVVHLAAVSLVSAAEVDPEAAYRTNVGGTLALLAAVRAHAPRARVVVVGSADAYGEVTDADLPVTEEVAFRPWTVYGATKAAADIAAGQWGRAYGLDVVRARPFNHTGPGQQPTFVCSALARQMAQVEAGTTDVVRVGNLDPVRDFSDVRDIAAGYVALLERGRAGEAYNICRGEGASIADVVAILRTHARVPVRLRVDPVLRRANDVPRVVGSHAHATRDTGWQPRIPLEETLGALLEDWRARV
jgi:GDP-4-dehydro-6-deoxy-D-mannose reductase